MNNGFSSSVLIIILLQFKLMGYPWVWDCGIQQVKKIMTDFVRCPILKYKVYSYWLLEMMFNIVRLVDGRVFDLLQRFESIFIWKHCNKMASRNQASLSWVPYRASRYVLSFSIQSKTNVSTRWFPYVCFRNKNWFERRQGDCCRVGKEGIFTNQTRASLKSSQ